MMNRRDFLAQVLTTTAALGTATKTTARTPVDASASRPFRLRFAPHEGQFRHHAGEDILDQIRFARDAGFTAWEDNRLRRRDAAVQNAIGRLLEKLGMTMGVFVAFADFSAPVFAGNRLSAGDRHRDPQAVRERLRAEMTASVELAKRVGARWATVVPGAADLSLLPEHQTANVADNLRFCAEIVERAGPVLVLEPLNYINHPGCFLQRAAQAHQICRMVDSPSVKILFDIYHQQISEGNLINNLSDAWDEIAYIQVGDVPGRKEPTTGEINYANIFRWLHGRGYRGIIGMEHGLSRPGREGELALIEAYRAVDVDA